MQDPRTRFNMNWIGKPNYPRPDYLSSSRKRLAPQLLFKGGILHKWSKKQAVVIHRDFFNTLPALTEITQEEAELAWLVYELSYNEEQKLYKLTKGKTVYTKFEPALLKITTAEAGPVEDFIALLQTKLDEKLDSTPPDATTLIDEVLS